MRPVASTHRIHGIRTAAPAHLFALIGQALAARRQRAALRGLDDKALNDIGISRSEAEREAARPPWDVPADWRR